MLFIVLSLITTRAFAAQYNFTYEEQRLVNNFGKNESGDELETFKNISGPEKNSFSSNGPEKVQLIGIFNDMFARKDDGRSDDGPSELNERISEPNERNGEQSDRNGKLGEQYLGGLREGNGNLRHLSERNGELSEQYLGGLREGNGILSERNGILSEQHLGGLREGNGNLTERNGGLSELSQEGSLNVISEMEKDFINSEEDIKKLVKRAERSESIVVTCNGSFPYTRFRSGSLYIYNGMDYAPAGYKFHPEFLPLNRCIVRPENQTRIPYRGNTTFLYELWFEEYLTMIPIIKIRILAGKFYWYLEDIRVLWAIGAKQLVFFEVQIRDILSLRNFTEKQGYYYYYFWHQFYYENSVRERMILPLRLDMYVEYPFFPKTTTLKFGEFTDCKVYWSYNVFALNIFSDYIKELTLLKGCLLIPLLFLAGFGVHYVLRYHLFVHIPAFKHMAYGTCEDLREKFRKRQFENLTVLMDRTVDARNMVKLKKEVALKEHLKKCAKEDKSSEVPNNTT